MPRGRTGPLTWPQVGEPRPEGPEEPALPRRLCWGSLSLLKYFRGGGLGLEDVGFLTRISKDFFGLSGEWLSGPPVRAGLPWGSSGAGPGPCVLPSGQQASCAALPPWGLPPGDPDM